MAFIIDVNPDTFLLNQDVGVKESNKTAYVTINEKRIINSNTKVQSSIVSFSKLMGWDDNGEPPAPGVRKKTKTGSDILFNDLDLKTGKLKSEKSAKTKVEKAMETCILQDIKTPDLAKLSMPVNKLKTLNRVERSKTKGSNWFNMPATEVTEEIKNDLEILQMRSALDPKRFYKKNDLKILPKYFQVGTYIDTPLDYYNNRGVKKNKKKTLVDELLADSDFQRFNKKKYKEVMETKKKTGYYKANQKMKKLKKKKK